ncbi:hypothetical protein H310_05568 [Aphanomyces invadans]|uniref:Nudix hydrolase domain-containing protein n=1 Tax=Aphanomyces invadans TaxID=157072 RepID=A0A024UA46_9STRA|nr:hypothetical protein H310_05568 [Aphanomyces invadans]ETW03149.1 hypothetical protein H310_05568 [Aphanomyces invadans]RHY34654.1 hypothetical protein DYB32_000738 [Aphanomyces invadans]|eukprot:XP_008868533.1 hypothetical protein H310_05568 [Aphanomyces invadans]
MSALVEAATVVCLRERSTTGTWEVLLGQSEVKNWLRSTPDTTVIMRYPGEWKFPGGSQDVDDESLQQTAIRELREEFLGIDPTETPMLRWLSTRTTLPVQGKRFRMHNFVALSDENVWLNDVRLVDRVNGRLADKRRAFAHALDDGSFWSMDTAAKEAISPEVHRVQWFPISTAIDLMEPGHRQHVNEFQATEFAAHGVVSRDPMYQTMKTLERVSMLSRDDIVELGQKKTSRV